MGSVAGSFSQSKSRPVDITPNEFKAIRSGVASQLQNIFGGGGQQYEGPLAAPVTGSEAAQLAALNQMAAGGEGLEPSIEAELSKSILGQYLNPETNPYLQATADSATRHLTQNLDQAELQNRALFSRAGQKIQESSPFATAQAITNRGYADAVGDVSTRIFGGNYQQERDRQVQATQLGGELERMRFVRGMENLKAQELPRLVADLGVTRGIAQFNEYVEDMMEALGLATVATRATPAQKSDSMSISQSAGFMS